MNHRFRHLYAQVITDAVEGRESDIDHRAALEVCGRTESDYVLDVDFIEQRAKLNRIEAKLDALILMLRDRR